jgi:hypothetical protein
MNLEERIKAEQQVEAFINVLSTRYGLKENEIPEILDNLRWISRHRAGVSRITWHASLGLVGLAVVGLAAAMWEGIRHFLTIPPPGP